MNSSVAINKKEVIIIQLTGKIELDEESIEKLRSEIREEVVNEISKDGLIHEEVTKYLKTCNSSVYFNIVRETIDNPINEGLSRMCII